MPCSFGMMFVQCASTKWFVHFVRLCLHQMGGGADDLWTLSCLLNVTVFMVGKWQESHRWFISTVLCVQFHIGGSSVDVSSSAIYFWCIWRGPCLWPRWWQWRVDLWALSYVCSYISSYMCAQWALLIYKLICVLSVRLRLADAFVCAAVCSSTIMAAERISLMSC